MSEIEEERSVEGGGGGGDVEGCGSDECDCKKKQRGGGIGGNLKNAKRVTVSRFRKVQKQLRIRNKKSGNPSSAAATGCLGKRVGGGGGSGGCYWCFKQTPTLDSPVGSQTSDPNCPEFTVEMLRNLIERNEFYSKECNPHLGIDTRDEN